MRDVSIGVHPNAILSTFTVLPSVAVCSQVLLQCAFMACPSVEGVLCMSGRGGVVVSTVSCLK
eukprot:2379599-Ditylum_brightwellii.AAC.1